MSILLKSKWVEKVSPKKHKKEEPKKVKMWQWLVARGAGYKVTSELYSTKEEAQRYYHYEVIRKLEHTEIEVEETTND